MPRPWFLVGTLVACACGAPVPTDDSEGPPSAFNGDLRLVEAVDLDPDPSVTEIALEARPATLEVVPGVFTETWTYDGLLPGPLIRARKGEVLKVHFHNALPEQTTVHWHGMRVPAAMDGVPELSQAVVMNGGDFEYSFVVPDAGLYWYHPHYNSTTQVGSGLYGALLVNDPDEAPLGDEVVLVLSDIGLQEDGTLEPPELGGDFSVLFGREGGTLLVNGKVRPTLPVQSGKLQRWRIVNTARSRYFQLAMEGHSFMRIGGDGGLSEYGVAEERLVIATAERADVLIVPVGQPGSTIPVRWVPYDRGYGSTEFRDEEVLFDVAFSDDAPGPIDELPITSRTIEPIDVALATPIAVDLTQSTDDEGHVVMGINGVPFADSKPFHGQLGETQLWTVSTEMVWSHPFHLHGFFFQVLDDNDQPRRPLQWKDTVDVPYEGQTKFAVRFDERPGMWMFHCHVLDHAEAGMMGHLHLSK